MSEDKFWRPLLQAIEEQRLIPIIGRELLDVEIEGRTVNLYTYLAERLATGLEVDGNDLPPRGELNEVVRRHMSAAGPRDDEEPYGVLKDVMPGPEDVEPPSALMKLAEIRPLKLFVTTTFDPMLERALNQVRFQGNQRTKVLAYSPEDKVDLDQKKVRDLEGSLVFHLLGKVSSVADFVVSDEDILEFVHALQSKSHRPNLLFDEMRVQQLLIIGSHFPDWLARFFIRATTGRRLSKAIGKSFLVDERIREDQGLLEFLSQFRTHAKVYQQGNALEFVDELHRRWLDLHPPTETLASPHVQAAVPSIPDGAVFLSYASEDIEDAQRIREALEGAGVEVWFDKEALKGGDDFEAVIRRNIDRCSVFIPVISRETLTRERRFFRIEWRCALDVAMKAAESQRYIVPVRIDDTPEVAPEIPEKFKKLHWTQFDGGQPSPEWILEIRDLYRAYQKSITEAP